MTFGWQGFSLDHPEDWAPVSLSGTYREGYARLASSSRLSLQLRWQHSKHEPNLEGLLESYLSRLSRDAKRTRVPFSAKSEEDGRYHWSGKGQGRGSVFFSEASSRVFFLEVTGERKDGLLPHIRRIRESFLAPGGSVNTWSLLGLHVRVPASYHLASKDLRAGLTRLCLRGRPATLECTRWGFAEQLLREFDLANWARKSLNMERASAEDEGHGIRLRHKSLTGVTEAIVAYQTEGNQIVTIKGKFGKAGGPQWDWLR